MENPHVQWRIDFAKRLTERLLAFEGIKAIVIAGQIARDYPDALAEQIIREHLNSLSVADLFILAHRNNPTAFYAQLSFLQVEKQFPLIDLAPIYRRLAYVRAAHQSPLHR